MRETLPDQKPQALPPMDKELQTTARSLTSRAKVLRPIAGPIAALAACALLLVLLNGLSRGLDYHGVTQALRQTPHRLVWISILLTAVSYLALVARDLGALSYVGMEVSTPALLLASFCGSALGNAISFKALTADAVRDRVYGAVGVSPEQTARVMLFINVAFGIGLAAFAALSLMLAGNAVAHLLPISITSIRCAGAAALLAILLALLLRSWRRQSVAIGRVPIEMPSLTITLIQLVASAVDLAAAAGALWFLLPHAQIDFFSFAAVFSAAIALGVISRLPGGFGVFDVVIFLVLRRFVPANELVAALLIYRGVYFVLPLLLAAASLALSLIHI